MLRPRHKLPDHLAALERVKGWTRERFRLAHDATVFVSEVVCSLPGCPPLETVVAFWTGEDRRHQFKIFKPVSELVAGDLPPVWLKEALIAMDSIDGDCC
jgi:nitrate reductase delta subunit